MSEHAMLIRCIHCGTDKTPVKNESELKDFEPWRCGECGESGVREDFFVLDLPVTVPLAEAATRVTHEKVIERIREESRQAGIILGRQMEREAVIRYFKQIGKPYYVALFREGEHLK